MRATCVALESKASTLPRSLKSQRHNPEITGIPKGEDMRENEGRESDPVRHLEMMAHASGQASLCLALCASCMDAYPDIAVNEREYLEESLVAAEASTAAIRWAVEARAKDENTVFDLLGMVETIRTLCAEICELCAQMCDTYVFESRRGKHYRICADICRAVASDCRAPIATIH